MRSGGAATQQGSAGRPRPSPSPFREGTSRRTAVPDARRSSALLPQDGGISATTTDFRQPPATACNRPAPAVKYYLQRDSVRFCGGVLAPHTVEVTGSNPVAPTLNWRPRQ